MNNRSENRGDMSTNNDRSLQNAHLSDEQLLLALDGELSARETALVEAHLESCWSCRTRSKQIGEAIADFVEYRNFINKRSSEPFAGTRAMLVAQVQELARNAGQPSLWNRIVGGLRMCRAFSQHTVQRHAW